MTIGMLGDFGQRPGTDFFAFVSLDRHLNSPVKKESSRTSMTRYGTKSMSLLCSFSEVNRMSHLASRLKKRKQVEVATSGTM